MLQDVEDDIAGVVACGEAVLPESTCVGWSNVTGCHGGKQRVRGTSQITAP